MADMPARPEPEDAQQEILALVLDKPNRASELLITLSNLQSEGKIKLHDAVIVTKDENGRVRIVETIDVTPAKGALAGTWWGMLGGLLIGGPAFLAAAIGGAAAGALYGKLVDHGLPDAWVRSMADWIDPKTSALLLMIEGTVDPTVVEELKRFEGIGRVASTTLPAGIKAEVEAALGQT